MTFKNMDQFLKRMDKRNSEAQKNLERAMFRAVSVVQASAIDSIAGGGKSGGTSTRYNPRRTHTASGAGEAPATDLGALVGGFFNEVNKSSREVVGIVGNSTPYAASLEFGTTNMAARPFMRPALQDNADKINDIFRSEGIIS